jgi:hypothetical protein
MIFDDELYGSQIRYIFSDACVLFISAVSNFGVFCISSSSQGASRRAQNEFVILATVERINAKDAKMTKGL